jgi:high-affinity nickel permease
VKKKHGFWTQFYGLRARHLAFIWVGLFVVFLMVSLLLLHL